MTVVAPGGTIGILGSGQLGRMLALAAAQLGLKSHIYADGPGPAFDVAAECTVGAYDDKAALAAFAAAVQAVTYEFENIPAETVDFLSRLVTVRPGAKALACAQDRLNEKQLARRLGAMTAEFKAVSSLADLEAAVDAIGLPAVLKTRRMGYDGKGQAKIFTRADIAAAWQAMGGQDAILESFVRFSGEVSVIAVRGEDGAFAAYDLAANDHRDHILHTSTVPSGCAAATEAQALEIAKAMADALDYVGVMGVEFFVVTEGGRETVYVNEIAPRVHNSGHWTMDACAVGQFENHIRAVADWPIGATTRHSDAVMTNLIGADAGQWAALAAEPGVCVHLYGKHEARAGRKMGHVNRLAPRMA